MRKIVTMLGLLVGWSSIVSADAGTFGAPIGKTPVGFRVEWTTDLTRSCPVADRTGHLQPTGEIRAYAIVVR